MKQLFLVLMIFVSFTVLGQTEHKYAIGDIYDVDGVKGIVIDVTDGGLHGLIMSLDDIKHKLCWCTNKPKGVDVVTEQITEMFTGADSKTDGEYNMRKIEEFIDEYDLTWEHFPAFKWCRDKGDGWYLPSYMELMRIRKAFHGADYEDDKSAQKAFNRILERNGGNKLEFYDLVSSTEWGHDTVYFLAPSWGVVGQIGGKGQCTVRAVRRF